jgi:AcrR family transcriptional regulator
VPREVDPSGGSLRGTAAGRGAELPATAQRLLEAARRIIAERGLAALTLDAVAEESGEYRSAIRYHFGDKAGLVSAVVDSTALSPATLPLFAAVSAAERGRPQAAAHVAALRTVASDREQFRLFWALLPQMLNDPALRARLEALYERYACINREALRVVTKDPQEERRLRGLARLLTAACDGLGLMTCLRADGREVAGDGADWGVDVDAAWEVLGEVIDEYVTRSAAPPSGAEPAEDEEGT